MREGAAWVYRQYARDPSLLVLEAEARQAGRGLWALPEAQITPPWEWRQAGGRTVQQPVARSTVADSGAFSCGGKRYCKQMTSCAEARFYLEQCGLSRLDGDRDGIPCEKICR
nr:excalibur calcium-binding domain-containing protein [Geminicoccus roseus]